MKKKGTTSLTLSPCIELQTQPEAIRSHQRPSEKQSEAIRSTSLTLSPCIELMRRVCVYVMQPTVAASITRMTISQKQKSTYLPWKGRGRVAEGRARSCKVVQGRARPWKGHGRPRKVVDGRGRMAERCGRARTSRR